MPFGLCNAPATFQRMINAMLRKYQWSFCLGYLDDIIIYSKTYDEHFVHIEKILAELFINNLEINTRKSEFCVNEVDYLGYKIGQGKIRIGDEKKNAILKYPRPKNKKQVEQFHGLASYFRKFIRNFATITKPLRELMRKDSDFKWKKEDEDVFNDIKSKLCSGPILCLPRYDLNFIVTTDASAIGLGAILS